MTSRPGPSPSVNHLVLSVRDLEASHRFYTEVVGFEQCGEMTHTMKMRFYRGSASTHHDLALAQSGSPDANPAPAWSLIDMPPGINHIAIGYPDRESWLAQLDHIKQTGVPIAVRGNHGMTHSAYVVDPDGNGVELLYNLPEEVWGGDVDAALNYFEHLPADDFADDTDYQHFGEGHEPPVARPGVVTRV
jgi:catechol-2,3-dioxygenase